MRIIKSLIENIHRENLKPMEQAKAILEVFKQNKTGKVRGDVPKIDENLPLKVRVVGDKIARNGDRKKLNSEELAIDKIVSKIGLSHHSVYESLY